MNVFNQAAHQFLQTGGLPGGAPLHQFAGDDGVVGRAYDFDLDAIDDAAAAADGGDDEDASMPDAEPHVVALVARDCLDAPAAAVDALDAGVLLRLAATPSTSDTLSASRLAFIAAAPSRALGARDAADDGLDAGAFLDLEGCGEQPFAVTASAGSALQALCARYPTLALAPTSFLRRLASDRDARVRFAAALAPRTTLDAAAGRGFEVSTFDAPALYGARHAGDALDVYDATACTVLDRSTALPFAGGARTISLLIAAGADARSGAHNASGDDGPLHLFAGALGSSSTEADLPDGAAATDGSTDAIDANGAAVPATTTSAASALPPELATRYRTTLTTLKNIRQNGYDGPGRLYDKLNDLAKGLITPNNKPMNRKAAYMTGKYWVKEPNKKKPKLLFLNDLPFLAALITELEAFLGLEPSTVDEALDDDDDDDDAEEAAPDTSLEAARRLLDDLRKCPKKSRDSLKARCADFGVDYSGVSGRDAIKRVLVARLKEIVADGDEEMSVDKRAKAVMAAIAMEAKGSGLDADEDEFHRVLWTVLCADRSAPVEIELRGDFLSAALAGLREELPSLELPDASTPEEPRASDEATPSPSRDTPMVSEEAVSSQQCEEAAPSPRPEKAPRASTFSLKSDVWEKIWTCLDGDAADALRVASRAGNTVVPERLALSMAVRRHAAVDEETDPKSRLTMLMDAFVAVDVNAPFPEVLAKVDEIARRLLLEPGLSTVHEGHEGRALSAGQHMRQIANNVPHAAVELAQLCLPESQRDPFFKRWTNDDVGCTINTQIKAHSVVKLLEHYVDAVLAGETEHVLDKVASKPSEREETTLETSLRTWRCASDKGRVRYMDTKQYTKHATTAARDIIRDASAAIEAQLAELTKDYPAEFDKAVKFFLGRFKPKDDAEAAEAAAWRSWLENPNHVNAVARKATGEV